MARKRASMREGPLAELFRKTEAAQRAESAPAEAEPEEGLDPKRRRRSRSRRPSSTSTTSSRRRPPRRRSRPSPARGRARARASRRAAVRGRGVARGRSLLPDDARAGPRLHRVPPPKGAAYIAVIRVVGVGGAGLNAIHRMIDAGIAQVDFVAVNTDLQALAVSDASTKIAIGEEVTQGLGSGADPAVGRASAEQAVDQLRTALRGSDMVFVTAGEGGGPGPAPRPSSRGSLASSARSRSAS